MTGNVRLVQGAQFRYQNAFRTISFGFAPYLPMTQSYKMGLDDEFAARGKDYFSLYPQDYSSSNDNRDGYSWMQRRFAYNAAGGGRLSSLNSYSRQKLALANPPKDLSSASAGMGSELSQLIAKTNAIGERQFKQNDIAELEMLILGRYAQSGDEKNIHLQGGNAMLKPDDYVKKMGLGADSELSQLSSQSFDMYFANEPGTKQITTGLVGEAGGTRGARLASKTVAFEMGVGKPANKFLTKTTDSSTFKDVIDAQSKFSVQVTNQIDKVNTAIFEKYAESDTFATSGIDLVDTPVINQNAYMVADNETHISLHAQFTIGTTNTLDSEVRRLLSRAQELESQSKMANNGGIKPGASFLEHQDLGNNYQGFVIMQPTTINYLGKGIPQYKALGVYVINQDTLANAARKWAKNHVLKGTIDIDKKFGKLQQYAIDESVKIAGRVKLVSTMNETAGISNIVDGMHINVHDAGGYAGIIGLSESAVAGGLEVKIRKAINGREFQGKFATFYIKMMEESNRLSTQWKKSVPEGTTSTALQSEEWTFGDGRQTAPPGGPRKRFLGIWGPTGKASGDYDNWKDSNRVKGENVSISPFLTSRRLGTASFGQ